VLVSVETGEVHLLPGRIKLSQHDEQVQIVAFGGADPELQPHAADQFNSPLESQRKRGSAVSTFRPIVHPAFRSGGFAVQRARVRIKVKYPLPKARV
jgi:hypothetical protein